jgi:hypothetical protein
MTTVNTYKYLIDKVCDPTILLLFKNTFDEKKITKMKILDLSLKNMFINEEIREKIINEFSKIQKVYYALEKLKRIYKYNKANVCVTTDLYLNDIDTSKNTNILIFQNGSKYWFTINDIMNIIINSITNCQYFHQKIYYAKNPYNKMIFTKEILYNIYFHIRNTNMVIPNIFYQYFLCNFDLILFEKKNLTLILDIYIKRYIDKTPSNKLMYYIRKIFQLEKKFIIDLFDKDIPVDELKEIMKPYLYLYFIHEYNIFGRDMSVQSFRLLKYKLKKFQENYPNFGRVKYVLDLEKMNSNKKHTITVPIYKKGAYNMEHINFTMNELYNLNFKIPTIENMYNDDYNNNGYNYNNNEYNFDEDIEFDDDDDEDDEDDDDDDEDDDVDEDDDDVEDGETETDDSYSESDNEENNRYEYDLSRLFNEGNEIEDNQSESDEEESILDEYYFYNEDDDDDDDDEYDLESEDENAIPYQ